MNNAIVKIKGAAISAKGKIIKVAGIVGGSILGLAIAGLVINKAVPCDDIEEIECTEEVDEIIEVDESEEESEDE